LLLERVGRAGGSAILGADGNVVLIGTRAGPGTLQTCLTTDGSIMAIGIPATR
jgi:hypothetical protein